MHDVDATRATLRDAFEKMATNKHREVSFESAYRSAYMLCLHRRHGELIDITKNGLIAAANYCLKYGAADPILLDRSRYDEVCAMFRDVLLFYNSHTPPQCPSFDAMTDLAWRNAVVELPRRVLRSR
jgi:hypothetical protein